MDIAQALKTLPHDPIWLDRYLTHLDTCPEPTGTYDRHHILPKALFPAFSVLKKHTWNCATLRPGDHLLAHYYLYKALPGCHPALWAFRLMVGRSRNLRALDNEALVREIADAYEQVRCGAENVPSVKGWVRMWRGEGESTVVPPEEVDSLATEGWSTQRPPRLWVNNGQEDRCVKSKEVDDWLSRGFVLGRTLKHTDATLHLMSDIREKAHADYKAAGGDYAYMPRGDSHHRRITGISQETKDLISKALTGRRQSPEHIEKRRLKLIGQKKPWCPAAKRRLSVLRKAMPLQRGFTFAGHTVSPELRAARSAAMVQRYRENPDQPCFTHRARGEAHPFYGKSRPESTRALISEALTGKTQSGDTIAKRRDTLDKIAYGKIPALEHNMFRRACTLELETEVLDLRRLTEANSRPYTILTGLMHLRLGTATEANRRAWQQAAAWVRISGQSLTKLSPRDPSVRLGTGHALTTGQISAHEARKKNLAKGVTRAAQAYAAVTPAEHAAFAAAWMATTVCSSPVMGERTGALVAERQNWPVRGRAYNILYGLQWIAEGKASVETVARWRQAGLWLLLSGRTCPVGPEALEELKRLAPVK